MANTVYFKGLRGANFMRFGNEEFSINFEEGVTGIFGENGLGKSAILDALCVCWFGEAYRDANKDDWQNNLNKNGLYLIGTATVVGSTTDEYMVTRRPLARKVADRIAIYKNGEAVLGIVNFQEYIENNILGFGINIFRNAIAVSAGTPFISMTPEQKRTFSDNLFSIRQVKDYKKRANEALSEANLNRRLYLQESESLKKQISDDSNMVDILSKEDDREIRISAIVEQIEHLNQYKETYHANVTVWNASIDNLKEEKAKLEAELEFTYSKLNELSPNEIYAKIATIKANIESCRKEYMAHKNEMDRIAPNVECNHCGNSFTEEQVETHKAKHHEEMKAIARKGNEFNESLIEYEAKLPEIEALRKVVDGISNGRLREIKSEIYDFENKIASAARQSNNNDLIAFRYNNQIEAIRSEVRDASALDLTRSRIAKCKEDIIKCADKYEHNEKRIRALNYIVTMCSDTGIKQLLLRKFTPLLNTLIDNYLRRFNLPVTVEFDELFKHKLSSVEGIGHKHGLLSKGQRKRIDIAILFAMVDLIKLMGSFNCNLLILDEFADDGLDSKGFRDVVHTIREVADRDKKSITIISHKNEDVLYDNLDSIYELELRNHFSVLRKVNNI